MPRLDGAQLPHVPRRRNVRLGVLSDVHANLPALEAVLAEMDQLKPDLIVNLGDCAAGPLWPAESVRLLRSRPISHVRGNHDRAMGQATPEGLGTSDVFAWKELEAEARHWLGTLPVEIMAGGARCFHACPETDLAYLMEEVHDARLMPSAIATIESRLGEPGARLLLCGHSHQPRIARLSSGAVIVNPGSVGCPAYGEAVSPGHASESGTPHARFAIVTLDEGEVGCELHAIPYDWESAARRAEANGRPEWAHALRTGTVLRA
jgi:putative phosphoesterase